MTALGDLITQHKGDRTFRSLAEVSGRISSARWEQFAHSPLTGELPDATIDAIAKTLGVPETDVVTAMYTDLYGDDPQAGRRRLARRARLAPFAAEVAMLREARRLGTERGQSTSEGVTAQLSDWTGLPAQEVTSMLRVALDLEARELREHPEDGPL